MKTIMEGWRKFKKINESPASDAFVQMSKEEPPLPQYVAVLKKIAKDPEFRFLAYSGRSDDSGPPDEALNINRTSTKAANLIATQAEIGFDNSLADQFTNKYESTDAALGNAGSPIIMPSADDPPPAILTYNGQYVLDGHHRWSQVMMTNPTAEVAIDDISGPGLENEEDALKVVQLAIAALAGQVKTKPFKGTNLMSTSAEDVYNAAKSKLTDEVIQKLQAAGKIKNADREEADKYYAKNLEIIKQRRGKFSREASMPQAGASGTTQTAVNQALSRGNINYKDPKPSDAEKG